MDLCTVWALICAVITLLFCTWWCWYICIVISWWKTISLIFGNATSICFYRVLQSCLFYVIIQLGYPDCTTILQSKNILVVTSIQIIIPSSSAFNHSWSLNIAMYVYHFWNWINEKIFMDSCSCWDITCDSSGYCCADHHAYREHTQYISVWQNVDS